MVFEEVQNPYSMVNMKQRKLEGGRVDAKRKVVAERKKKEGKEKKREKVKKKKRKKKEGKEKKEKK